MHDFVEIAGAFRTQIEEAVTDLFTPAGLLTGDEIPAPLAEVMRYALRTPGKRLRPVLCLAACAAVSGDAAPALPAALAVETLHNYTLVHDDLPCMDNDLLRRGQPTVHAKFGYPEAVLAGDALQAAAFQLLLRSPVPAQRICEIADVFARAAGPAGVVGGQWEDCCVSGAVSQQRLAYVHRHKTGDLIQAALTMGAIAGGAAPPISAAFSRFGYALGTAFQIIDDLLDADDPAKAEELSILRLHTREDAIALAQKLTQQALRDLEALPPVAAGEQARALLCHLASDQLTRTC